MLAADAGLLTQSRADPAGKLREIAGLAEPRVRMPHMPLPDLIIPLRDQIVQRAAGHHAVQLHGGLAEGHAAVHAASCLLDAGFFIQRCMKFIEGEDSLADRYDSVVLPCIIQKTGRFTHVRSPP